MNRLNSEPFVCDISCAKQKFMKIHFMLHSVCIVTTSYLLLILLYFVIFVVTIAQHLSISAVILYSFLTLISYKGIRTGTRIGSTAISTSSSIETRI